MANEKQILSKVIVQKKKKHARLEGNAWRRYFSNANSILLKKYRDIHFEYTILDFLAHSRLHDKRYVIHLVLPQRDGLRKGINNTVLIYYADSLCWNNCNSSTLLSPRTILLRLFFEPNLRELFRSQHWQLFRVNNTISFRLELRVCLDTIEPWG